MGLEEGAVVYAFRVRGAIVMIGLGDGMLWSFFWLLTSNSETCMDGVKARVSLANFGLLEPGRIQTIQA